MDQKSIVECYRDCKGGVEYRSDIWTVSRSEDNSRVV